MHSLGSLSLAVSMVDSVLLTYAAYAVAGRLAGIGMSIICGAGMAFFVMPPVFSFHISQMRDAVALACYGAGSIALTFISSARAGSGKSQAENAESEITSDGGGGKPSSSLSDLIPDEMRTAIEAREINVVIDRVYLPLDRAESSKIIADLLTAALEDERVRRVSIESGQRPGLCLLKVMSHRVWPPPAGERITIGQTESKCTQLAFEDWPTSTRANWFDNGYARIYQVSIGQDGAQPNTAAGGILIHA